MTTRIPWDDYFLSIARQVATRSTCPRLSVGAVIVGCDRNILSTGYNGAVSGAPHCFDAGCVLEDGHCMAAVHAEANAIVRATRTGACLSWSTIYITVNPCLNCFKLIVQAGVKRIVYGDQIPTHLYRPVDYTRLGLSNNSMPSMVKLDSGKAP